MKKLTKAQETLLAESAAPKGKWSDRGDGRVCPYTSDYRPCGTLEVLGLIEKRKVLTADEIAPLEAQKARCIAGAREALNDDNWQDAAEDLRRVSMLQRKIDQTDYFVTDAGYEYLKGRSA